MPFSNALDGFVRGFSVGSEQVRSAQEMQMKKSKYDADIAESQARERYYDTNKGKGVPTDGVVPDKLQEGQGKFSPTAAVPTYGSYDPAPINEENDKLGLPSGHLRKTAELESRLDPNATNNKSSAGGLFQFTDETAKGYGLANKFDPVASTHVAGVKAVTDSRALAPVLGRAPTGPELYLAHNQGQAGAKALLANPSANAIAALSPLYKSNPDLARQAIINNGGNPNMTAAEFVQQIQKRYNSQAAIGGGSEFAAHGGVVGQYADGGEAQKPYYIDDLKNDVSNALGKLGDVVKGGLQGIEEQFGLSNPPAVPTADAKYMQGVEAFQRNEGAAPPEQIEQVKRTVDPDNKLGDALGTTYGMVESYYYHLSKGDLPSAKAAASSVLLYTRAKSQQLGALAYHALENGDETAAAKAIEHAFNILPNAQKLQMKDGKALVIDQRTGDVVRELNFTPETMANAAMGFANGQAFLNDLANVTKSEKENVAAITAGSRVDVANINQSGLNERNTATLGVRVSEGAANRELKASEGQANRDVKTSEGAANRELKASEGAANRDLKASEGAQTRASQLSIAQLKTEAHSSDIDKSNAAKIQLKQMGIDADKDILDDKQEFKAVESNKDRALKTSEGAANRESREGIASGHDQTRLKAVDATQAATTERANIAADTSRANNQNTNQTRRKNTLDTLDAGAVKQANDIEDKNTRLDKRLTSQEGIADKRFASQEKQTGMRTTSNEKIAGENNQTRRDVSSDKNATDLEKTGMNIGDKQFRQNVNNTFKGGENDKKLQTQKDISGAGIASREKIAGDKNKLTEQIATDNREGKQSMAATRAASVRNGKELDRLNKMTNHEVLGVDEAITPKVNPKQAQTTRNIARSIVEGGNGKIYGDQAADIARAVTTWDAEKGRPKYNVGLSETPDGYSMKLPNGQVIPLTQSGYQTIKSLRDEMATNSR